VQADASHELANAVLDIARLGQKDREGWWMCHGFDRTGQYVLSRSFPRTWRSAAMELSVRSAARVHEDRLLRKVHLFSDRLPFRRWASSWLADHPPGPELETLTMLEAQTRYAGSVAVDGEHLQSGLRLGELRPGELEDASTVIAAGRLLVRSYLNQNNGSLLLPYFDCP
jgi:hypothetical protein